MNRTALVVDDSMLIRHTVCRYFEQRGFGVESATNGAEALEILRDLRPQIIITDLQMPKMNGQELIAALKSNPETSAIPIVVLASRKSGADAVDHLPADYVIFKDIDIESQLRQVLEKAFRPASSDG